MVSMNGPFSFNLVYVGVCVCVSACMLVLQHIICGNI